LVTKDSVSYFLGPDGKPSRKTTLTWSQPPNALVAGRLYVAALLPGGVEVKSISRVGASAAAQVRTCIRAVVHVQYDTVLVLKVCLRV
jgi:hypothetical protein